MLLSGYGAGGILNTEEAQEVAMNPPPVAVGMILCDYVHLEDGSTRKISLIGTFHALRVERFPATPRFYVFVIMTNGVGNARITLKIESLQTGEVVEAGPIDTHFENKLQLLKVYFPVRVCTFPILGWYQASIFVDGDFIAHSRFRVFSSDEE
jgi:hypothetical protein